MIPFDSLPPALAICLGLPICFSLGAITSVARWDASKATLLPATESDAGMGGLQTKSKLVRSRLVVAIVAVIVFIVTIVVLLWLWLEFSIVALVSLCGASFCYQSLLRLLSMVREELTRRPNGAIIIRNIREGRYQGMAISLALFCICNIPFVAYLYIPALSFLFLAIIAATMPYITTCLFNDDNGRGISLRLMLSLVCGLLTAGVGVLAIFTLVITSDWFKSLVKPGTNPKPEPEMSASLLAVFQRIFVLQLLFSWPIVLGQIISTLYQIDTVIARGGRKVGMGVGLVDDVRRGDVTEQMVVGVAGERKSSRGRSILVPSIGELLFGGGIWDMVRPFYAAIACGTVITLVGPSTLMSGVICSSPPVPSQGGILGMMCEEMAGEYNRLMTAFMICPFALVVVIGATSLIRGEADFVWNFRADWSAVASSEGGGELDELETNVLLKEEEETTSAAEAQGKASV